MKILLAPDKFKGSLSAQAACEAIGSGLQQNNATTITTVFHPMADGGDGSLQSIASHLDLTKQSVQTSDPLGRPISTTYLTSSKAAFIEVASSSGLMLLDKTERNPLLTSTYGTGKMIVDALERGYTQIYLFLGGSATNDGGIGIAHALGYRFLDAEQKILTPCGENLFGIQSIQRSLNFNLTKINLTLLFDVENPLFGKQGAAHVYAPQKGASPEQVHFLDKGLKHFSRLLQKHTCIDVSKIAGGGAAGGIGAGLTALLGAKLVKGFNTIANLTGLEQQIQQADWVISGEGCLDEQSLQGKVIDGVAALCKKYKKPLTLFVGKNDLSPAALQELNVASVFSILAEAQNETDAMLHGAAYLEQMAGKILWVNK